MKSFLMVLCMFMSACSATAAGMALILGSGWEVGLGFGVFTAMFYKVGVMFK